MSTNSDATARHIADLLPEYVNNTLDPRRAQDVRNHLAACMACRVAWDAWRPIAAILQESAAPVSAPAPPLMLPRIWTAIAEAELRPATRRTPAAHLAWGGRLLLAQARLIRGSVWLASACGFVAVLLYAEFGATRPEVDTILGLSLPLIAAAGVAFLYGPESDPALEITRATPVPAGLVLLARWGLLAAYDLGLALGVTGVLATSAGRGLESLTALWLGPMALLSTISLLGALLLGPLVAVGGALALWLTRLVPFEAGRGPHLAPDPFWQTSPLIFVLAGALFLLAVLSVDRRAWAA